MPLRHKFDPAKWSSKKQLREDIKNNPGTENSVVQLRDRVNKLEQAFGFK